MDFVRFLIHEDLYASLAWCFRHNICSTWFLDIRISTCFLTCCTTHTIVPRGLLDGTHVQVLCPEAVKAYNEHMNSVDLADYMCRFYTYTHTHTNAHASGTFDCFGF